MKRALFIGLFVIFSGIIFGPLLVTTAWHLRHGNFVKCADKQIMVPLRWYPTGESRSVLLVKLAPTIFTDQMIKAYVALSPLSKPPQTRDEINQLYEILGSLYWTKLAGDKEVVEGPIRIGAGTTEASCMHSFPQNNRNWSHDMCIVFQGAWSADFQGRNEDRETFYKVILAHPR
jgi:hypothetical protein